MAEMDFSKKRGANITPLVFLSVGLFFILVGYVFTRVFFWILNNNYFSAESSETIFLAFIHGLRFDLSAIAYLNIPLLLFLFFLIWFHRFIYFNILIFCYLLFIDVPAIIINLIDTIYFPYTGRRSGPEVFSMVNDLKSQMPQLIFVYYGYVVASILLFIIYYFIFSSLKKKIKPMFINKYLIVFLFCVLVLLFILAARGGFQSKPIRVLNAYSYPSSSVGALVLNTPFSLLKENVDHLNKLDYFSSKKELQEKFNSPLLALKKEKIKKNNVVIIILESFGLEYFGPPYGLRTYTPFLQNLARKGRFFPNGIANGRRSIEAVTSIITGIPSLMPEAFIRSPYQSNTVYGLGEIVKPYGYSTAFFHGAKNGSMYFDDTTYRFGFDKYYGRNEYPDSSQFDGQWGIFDEPFLQFSLDELDTLKAPFMAGIFTISSHTPYTLPGQYENTFPGGDIPMHRVVQYSDMALRKFFERAATKEWYENTLFVITADHTSDNFDIRFANPLGRHQIPIILYQPNKEIEVGIVTEIAQQIDIPATIIDYLNLPEKDKVLPFARSLLIKNDYADAIIKEDDAYWLLSQDKYVKWSITENTTLETGYLPETFARDQNQIGLLDFGDMEQRLKAYLQVYTNGLVDNSLYSFVQDEEK
jgi:phosphoglycerol transferase MdoB-like AlkP superfamily enzyme